MEAAFFDLDKTIVARSSPLALGPTFYRQGLIGGSALLKAMYAQAFYLLWGASEDRMEKMREEAARISAGWEQERVREVVTEVLEEVISPLIYSEALDLIFEHHEAGRLVCIVSSSPAEIVEPLAEMLDVDMSIATRAVVKDGKYTGELEFYCYGAAKTEAIQELAAERGIDLGDSYAYSDSITDLPMLEAVGHPVAIDPDRQLAAIAAERGWEVRHFRKPISLRDRLTELKVPELRVPQFNMAELRPPDELLANRLYSALAAIGLLTTVWWGVRVLGRLSRR